MGCGFLFFHGQEDACLENAVGPVGRVPDDGLVHFFQRGIETFLLVAVKRPIEKGRAPSRDPDGLLVASFHSVEIADLIIIEALEIQDDLVRLAGNSGGGFQDLSRLFQHPHLAVKARQAQELFAVALAQGTRVAQLLFNFFDLDADGPRIGLVDERVFDARLRAFVRFALQGQGALEGPGGGETVL